MRHPGSQVQGLLARWLAATAATAAGLTLVGVVLQAPEPAVGADRDCADFSSQAAAQDFLESHGPGDPHGLDGDGDGVACESNPCPCSSDGGGDGGGGGGGGSATGPKHGAVVTGIADGDTIEVRVRGRTEDVRLIGIDTPEIYFGAECGGAQASASIKRMLSVGDRVKLIRDRSQDNRDAYHRLLRYVERRGGDIGRKQIRKGWAKVYVFQGVPFDRVVSYRRAELRAGSRDRGVWERCDGDFHLPL